MSSQSSWKWLRRDLIVAVHDAQIAEHGGATGTRSPELLESALARARALATYGTQVDAIAIGAMYAISIAHNHPFVDGNKRVAWVALRTFLQLNGVSLKFDRSEAVMEMLALAAGERTDEQFTAWVRRHSAPR